MAGTATAQILVNGDRNLVVKYTLGGTTGDTTAGSLLDASATIPSVGVSELRIARAQWSLLAGVTVTVLWDATTNVTALELAGQDDQDYSEFGGILNNAGTGVTGDVLYTTTGYTAVGGGHFILHFRKS